MPEIILSRTGDVPLKFEGDCIAEVSTRLARGQERNRWFEVALYRTRGAKYVLAIGYRTQWQGEHDVDSVIPCVNPEEVRQELQLFDPLRDVTGYPLGEAYAEKQARLERTLRLDWANAIRELFQDLGPDFAETIE
jgi:hypothetical protein